MRSLFLLVALAGCAPDIGGDDAEDENVDRVAFSDATFDVDASSYDGWVYVDLEGQAEVPEADPAWDLAFLRYNVKVNGGVSGDGGAEVAILDEDYDSITTAPVDGYLTDEADADDDGVDEFAFAAWYDYDPSSHEVSPRDTVFVLHTVEGTYIKLRFDAYYDDAGTSGMLSLSWANLDAPEAE